MKVFTFHVFSDYFHLKRTTIFQFSGELYHKMASPHIGYCLGEANFRFSLMFCLFLLWQVALREFEVDEERDTHREI